MRAFLRALACAVAMVLRQQKIANTMRGPVGLGIDFSDLRQYLRMSPFGVSGPGKRDCLAPEVAQKAMNVMAHGVPFLSSRNGTRKFFQPVYQPEGLLIHVDISVAKCTQLAQGQKNEVRDAGCGVVADDSRNQRGSLSDNQIRSHCGRR